jgi:hypothetical protein
VRQWSGDNLHGLGAGIGAGRAPAAHALVGFGIWEVLRSQDGDAERVQAGFERGGEERAR